MLVQYIEKCRNSQNIAKLIYPAKLIWVWFPLFFLRKFSIFKLFAIIDTYVNEIKAPKSHKKKEALKFI